MSGYVAQRRGRFYAVIYEGKDPVTGQRRAVGAMGSRAELVFAAVRSSRGTGVDDTMCCFALETEI